MHSQTCMYANANRLAQKAYDSTSVNDKRINFPSVYFPLQ